MHKSLRLLLILAIILSGCSQQESTISGLSTTSVYSANWNKLQDRSTDLYYEDLAPFLNHANVNQAKGILNAFPNINDKNLIEAHIALIENLPQKAYELIKSELTEIDSDSKRELFFSILSKSGHWEQAVTIAPADRAARAMFYETSAHLAKPKYHLEPQAKAWADLFLILKKQYEMPEYFHDNIKTWHNKHPEHSANTLLNLKVAMPTAHVKLGVMLPLSGNMKSAGQSIREGIMAAHMASSLRKEWALVFFDTNQVPIHEIYHRGQADGITHWIGPLQKQKAKEFVALARHPERVLLLNEPASKNSNIRTFTLDPEDESIQVSQKLLRLGYRHVLMIEGTHPWSARQTQAFIKDFTQHGGHITDHLLLENRKHAKIIRTGLKISDGQENYQHIQSLTREPIKYIPTPRTDFDAVFLATSPHEALQVKPLLKYNLTGDIPVFATSSIVNDRPSSHRDKDLDGIIFCDSLTNIRFDQHSELQTRIIGLLNILQSSNSQKYKDQYRFFALGIDAYHLQLFKHRLDIIPSVGISGASGHLTLDDNKIKRKLYWGRYQNGKIINYTLNL